MAKILRNLRVKRVDLVTEGASYDEQTGEGAHALLYKSRATKGMDMDDARGQYTNAMRRKLAEMADGAKTPGELRRAMYACMEEMDKAARPRGDAMTDPEKIAKLEADLKAAEALADEEQKKRETAEAALKAAKETPEELEKSRLAALPESVRKQLKDQADMIAKLQADQEKAQYVAKCRELGLAETSAEVLSKVAKALTPEEFTSLEETLKAKDAQAAVGKRSLFSIVGKDDKPGASDPEARINALVAEARKADPKLTVAEATEAVTKSNPELYREYTAVQRAK